MEMPSSFSLDLIWELAENELNGERPSQYEIETAIRKSADATFRVMAETEQGPRGLTRSLCLVVCSTTAIQEANRTFRYKDKVTNVLSFPSGFDDVSSESIEAELPLGDIMICAEQVFTESLRQNKSALSHFSHLTCHGILHLLGYDHIDADEANEMEALEISIMNRLGFSSPY